MAKTSWNAGTVRPDSKYSTQRLWYLKNKTRILIARKKYRLANKDILEVKRKILVETNLKSWFGLIPETTQCQMCSKEIFFISNHPSKSIHFDHRNEGLEPIKGSPKHWLRHNPRNPQNEKLWTASNFGMLCWQCNRFLPTKNRSKIIENLLRYMEVKNAA